MIEKHSVGFKYIVELVSRRTGEVLGRETKHNLMPDEGMNFFLDGLLNQGAQVPAWYILPFGNNYDPQRTDTAATFPSVAGELTNYSSATRVQFVSSPAVGGISDNSAARAEFNFLAPTAVRGAAIMSTPSKGAAAGILLSAALFSSPKNADPDMTLRVLAGIQLMSL